MYNVTTNTSNASKNADDTHPMNNLQNNNSKNIHLVIKFHTLILSFINKDLINTYNYMKRIIATI